MIIRLLILTILIFRFPFSTIAGPYMPQAENPDSYIYRVYFTDKGNTVITDYSPEELLSPSALARREKCGVGVLLYNDLPVNAGYIESVRLTGLTWRLSSKWMNTALFTSDTPFDTEKVTVLPFVRKVLLVKAPAGKAPGSEGKDAPKA